MLKTWSILLLFKRSLNQMLKLSGVSNLKSVVQNSKIEMESISAKGY